MNTISIANHKLSGIENQGGLKSINGRELEEAVGVALLGDLNQQLADISSKMEIQVNEKQSIRQEIETIYQLKIQEEIIDVNGENHRDISPEAAKILKITEIASPQVNDKGEITSYLVKEDVFQEASTQAIKSRENRLSELNSNSELTMLKIQSLVDQRKNALSLLSNLMASANDVAKTIIGNIRS